VDLESHVQGWLAGASTFTGVMAFSRRLLLEQITLKMLAQRFFDTMNPDSIMNLDFLKYGIHTDINTTTSTLSKATGNRSWSLRKDFSSSFNTHEESWFFGAWTDKGNQKINGTSLCAGLVSVLLLRKV
jgi:hypothetical protein